MNEDAAVQAVYDTLETNKVALVSGIEQNGLAKSLSWLSNTMVAVPDSYYAVAVHCENVEEFNEPDAYNANLALPYHTNYQMMIRLGDAVYYDPSDTKYGSVATTNFRDFCDKVVKLFRRDQTWFPSSTASPKYRLLIDSRRGRVVRKENDIPMPIEDGITLVSSTIRFTLCGYND